MATNQLGGTDKAATAYETREFPIWSDDSVAPAEHLPPMSFTSDDIERIQEVLGSDRRRRWKSFGTWRERPSRLVLYRIDDVGTRFTITRFADGSFELADSEGRAIRTKASLAQVLDDIARA